MGVEEVQFGDDPYKKVYYDTDHKHDHAYWSTQYRDTFTPTKENRRSHRAPKEQTAGKKTRNFEGSDQWRGMESRVNAQKEIYSSTLSLNHSSRNDSYDPFAKTSDVIGSGSRPPSRGNHFDRRPDSAPQDSRIPNPYEREYEEYHRSAVSTPNIRNAWNRNKSAVGEVVFQTKVDRKGVPLDKRSKKQRHRASSEHRRRSSSGRDAGDHFVTTKDAFDNETVGTAIHHRMYGAEPTHSLGFNIHGKKKDDTTVSGDAPAWFQLPGVTVNKLSSLQLYNLLSWKAPIPKKHTAEGHLEIFGVEGDQSKTYVNPDLQDHSVPTMDNARPPAERESSKENVPIISPRPRPESPMERLDTPPELYRSLQAEDSYESKLRSSAPAPQEEPHHGYSAYLQEQQNMRPPSRGGSDYSDARSVASMASSLRSKSSHGSRQSYGSRGSYGSKGSRQNHGGGGGSFTMSNIESMTPGQLADALKKASVIDEHKYESSRRPLSGRRGDGSVRSGYTGRRSNLSSEASFQSLSTM
ncbi:hypothetical protein CYMTET_3215 [Cymbomonas tetramitiformis]|uniref:Uncharacterized protein n=1 Tax=Cymbomonas tetramitiformis TaxID=36881 RepID=A0AAE0H3Q8_9CHLO|nr:hypothetical protein CYMTET_3215 [Cymbomonas tetramitiformis]